MRLFVVHCEDFAEIMCGVGYPIYPTFFFCRRKLRVKFGLPVGV